MMSLIKGIAVFAICISSTLNVTYGMKDVTYSMSAIVTKADEIVDARGEAWEYVGIPYSVGTEIKVTFSNNGTQDVTDDIILSIEA